MIEAKERRERANEERLQRIESEIEGREKRAIHSLKKKERKAELERELRLMEKQERTVSI